MLRFQVPGQINNGLMSLPIRSLLVLAVGAVLGFGVSVGTNVLADHQAKHADAAAAAVAPGIAPEYMRLLTDVLERVHSEYVDRIDDKALIESAIHGVLENLDPHSRYLDPTQYADMRISTTGNYSGVGLDLSLKDGKVTVISPLDGAPASRAGIRAGDIVVAVDHVPVSQDNIEETVDRMRGMAGTIVNLEVRRAGDPKPLQFALKRADIEVRTVHSAYLGHGYGYIRITSFADTTAPDVKSAAKALIARAGRPLAGLVLDLRNNPGGVLDAAVGVADQFLASGLIVRGEGRVREARFAEYARPGDLLEKVPVAVLVNGGSASASEIVAGALHDRGRARLVGQRTYGKGSVQTVMPLGEGRAIKLTTSLYYTPSGRSINGVGIEPDVVIAEPATARPYHGTGGGAAAAADPQLTAALDALGDRSAVPKEAPATTQAAR